MEIAGSTRWAEKHYRSFEQSYRRAPFWTEHEPFLRSIYLDRTWRYLVDLNEAIIQYLLNYLAIPVPMVRASSLGVDGTGTELLIGLTRKVGGTTYLSGPSGRNYLDEGLFPAEGVKLVYHQYEHPVYPQGGDERFVANLSIFDLIFRHGPESREILRGSVSVRAAH